MSLHCVRRALVPAVLAVLFAFVTLSATPAGAGELRPAPSVPGSPAASLLDLLDRALSLLGGTWTEAMQIVTGHVSENNGVGIDPNGGTTSLLGDNGAGIDPNGGQTLVGGDNGAGIDPNG